jgi:hypothetical protein
MLSSKTEPNQNGHSNVSPAKGMKIQNSFLDCSSDSSITDELPDNPKGVKNHWAVIMKLMDEDTELKEKEQREFDKKKQQDYKVALEGQIRAHKHREVHIKERDSLIHQEERDQTILNQK